MRPVREITASDPAAPLSRAVSAVFTSSDAMWIFFLMIQVRLRAPDAIQDDDYGIEGGAQRGKEKWNQDSL